MLMNLRNALMAGKRLPYDAEVEYLSSSENASAGTSDIPPVYIDTGVALSSGLKMSVIAAFNSTANQIMGCYGGTSGRFDIGINASRIFLTSIGATCERSTADTNIHEFVLDAPNALAYIDGVSVATGAFSVAIPGNIILFSRGRGDRTPPLDYTASVSKVNIKIYTCKIWQNGVLVRDFIPVRVGTVGYMYDRVSGKLFGNAGSGDFVLGPDVVPVEYIESHRTEWIDTGYVLSASDRIVVQAYFKANDNSGSRVLLGVNNPKLWITTGLCRFNGDNSAAINTLRQLEAWNSISIDKDYCTCNGTTVPMSEGTFQNNNLSLWLFGANNSTIAKTDGRISSCKIYNSNVTVRSFLPVRVGTEGAMMDVLTRRIYRNAGTGAFAYGNDLKYPIPAE